MGNTQRFLSQGIRRVFFRGYPVVAAFAVILGLGIVTLKQQCVLASDTLGTTPSHSYGMNRFRLAEGTQGLHAQQMMLDQAQHECPISKDGQIHEAICCHLSAAVGLGKCPDSTSRLSR